jgi:hypothetical protein
VKKRIGLLLAIVALMSVLVLPMFAFCMLSDRCVFPPGIWCNPVDVVISSSDKNTIYFVLSNSLPEKMKITELKILSEYKDKECEKVYINHIELANSSKGFDWIKGSAIQVSADCSGIDYFISQDPEDPRTAYRINMEIQTEDGSEKKISGGIVAAIQLTPEGEKKQQYNLMLRNIAIWSGILGLLSLAIVLSFLKPFRKKWPWVIYIIILLIGILLVIAFQGVFIPK